MESPFHDFGHSLPSEITCRKTVLQLSADELQRTRNALYDKQIFLVVDESILSGTLYLNTQFGSLETSHVSVLYNCQPLPCAPNSNSIAQTVKDAVGSLGIKRNPVFYYLMQ